MAPLEDLKVKLQQSRVNFEEKAFHFEQGEFGFDTSGLLIRQQHKGKEYQTGFFYGEGGALYSFNPENRSRFMPVMPRAWVDEENQVQTTNPVDRILNIVKTGSPIRSSLMNQNRREVGPQGTSGIPVARYVAQPNIENIYAQGVQLGGKKSYQNNQIIEALNREKGPLDQLLRFKNVGMATKARAYTSLVASGIDNYDGEMGSLYEKPKRIQLAKGDIAGVDAYNGRSYGLNEDPFYFQNQKANKAFNIREGFGLFTPLPEGQGITSNLFATVGKSAGYTLPKGTTYSQVDGKDVFTLPTGETIQEGSYFGQRFGQAMAGMSRVGGSRTFRNAFNESMGSYGAKVIDQISPALDSSGNFTGRVNVAMRGFTQELSEKYGGTKLNLLRTNAEAIPESIRGDVDVYSRLPGEGMIPSLALQVLKGQMNADPSGGRAAFENWFSTQAANAGKDASWINSNLTNGSISAEAAPMVTQWAIANMLNQMKPVTEKDVHLGPMEFEAARNASFISDTELPGSMPLTNGKFRAPVIPNLPGNITQDSNGTYTVGQYNNMIGAFNVATNFRPESVRDKMNLSPGTLSLTAQYNPELFKSLMNMSQVTRKNNMALNLVSAYRANYSPEQEAMVRKTYGVADITGSEVRDLRQYIVGSNPNLTSDEVTEELTRQLNDKYGNQVLSVDAGGQKVFLPSAKAVLGSLTQGSDRELINNWATKQMSFLSSLSSSTPDELKQGLSNLFGDPSKKGTLSWQANLQGTLRQAMSITTPRLGGITHGVQGLSPDTVIASKAHISRITGITDEAQLQAMAESGELNSTLIRYPPSDVTDMYSTTKMKFYEDLKGTDLEWVQEKYRNPGKGLLVSPEVQAREQGDFDADRVVALLNAVKYRGAGAITGKLATLTNSEILTSAQNKFESEYKKRVEEYSKRSGFNTEEVIEKFKDPKNIFRTLFKDLSTEFRADPVLGSGGEIGINYNTFLRTGFGASNKTAQTLFGKDSDAAKTLTNASSDIYHFVAQGKLDRKSGQDEAVAKTIDLFRDLYKPKGGTGFGLGGPRRSGWESFAENSEELYQKSFQNFSMIGGDPSKVSDEEYINNGLRRGIAASLMNRNLLNGSDAETRISQVEDLLMEQRKNGPSLDLSTRMLTAAGYDASNPDDRFSVWGRGTQDGSLKDMSTFAEILTGSVAMRYKKTNGAYPDSYMFSEAGASVEAAAGMQNSVEKPSKGISGVVESAGGSPEFQDYIHSLIPGAENAEAFLNNIRQLPEDFYGGSGYLRPSKFTYGEGKDDTLLRLAHLNAKSGDEAERLLGQMYGIDPTAFKEWHPFSGAGDPSAARVGKEMEIQALGRMRPTGSVLAEQKAITANRTFRTGTGYADAILKTKSGDKIVADIKTKNKSTLMSDILSPKVSSDITAQVGIYQDVLQGEGVSQNRSWIVAGLRPDGVANPTPDQMMTGFEDAYNEAQTVFNNPTAPAGWDPSTWDATRNRNLAAMSEFESTYGFKAAVRELTGDETVDLARSRASGVRSIGSINQKFQNPDLAQRAQQLMDIFSGKKPSVPSGGGGGTSGGGGSAAVSPDDDSGGSSGIPLNASGGSSGSGSSKTINAQIPTITRKQLVEAYAAMKDLVDETGHLTDASKKLTSSRKEEREQIVTQVDALKKVGDYLNKVEWTRSVDQSQGIGPERVNRSESFKNYSDIFGAGQEGVIGDTLDALRKPTNRAALLNFLSGDEAEEKPGFIQRTSDRLIQGQGLFHAKLEANMFIAPIRKMASEYQEYQASLGSSLYQSGQMSYSDLMSGYYGKVVRREAMTQQAGLNLGQQALNAYSPLVNAFVNPETASGPLGTLAAVGTPAIGAGMIAKSLSGSNPIGWGVLGATAAYGALSTLGNALSPTDIRSKIDLGNAALGKDAGFSGNLGYGQYRFMSNEMSIFTGNNSSIAEKAAAVAGLPIMGAITLGQLVQGKDIDLGRIRSEVAQAGALSSAVSLYRQGVSLDKINLGGVVNPSDVVQGSYDQAIQQLGIQNGLDPAQATKMATEWAAYSPTMPSSTDLSKLASLYQANASPIQYAASLATAKGISPFNQQAMAPLVQSAKDKLAALPTGVNKEFYSNQISEISGDVTSINALRRQAGLNEFDPEELYALRNSNPTQYQAKLGSGGTEAQLKLANPLYFSKYGKQGFADVESLQKNGFYSTASILRNQVLTGENVSDQLAAMGQTGPAADNFLKQWTTTTDAVRSTTLQGILSGNQMIRSAEAVRTNRPDLQTLNPQTGMDVFYRNVPQQNIDVLRANGNVAMAGGGAFDYFRLSDKEAATGTQGWEARILQNSRNVEAYQYLQRTQSRDLSYALTTGNLSGAAQVFSAYGMDFNTGNGMGYRQIENAQRDITRSQQMFSWQQESSNLALSYQQQQLGYNQFYAQHDLSQRQLNYQTGYQREQMSIDRSHQQTQFQWQEQDWSYNRSQLDIGFSWQMQDYNRNIRYARGRDKIDLLREQSRSVIQYSMQASHSDVELDRLKTQEDWAKQLYERQKSYFDQNKKFQQEALNNQKKYFDEGFKLDQQRLQLQQTAHNKAYEWMTAEWKLEDQTRSLQRQDQDLQYKMQVDIDTMVRTTTLDSQRFEDALNRWRNLFQEISNIPLPDYNTNQNNAGGGHNGTSTGGNTGTGGNPNGQYGGNNTGGSSNGSLTPATGNFTMGNQKVGDIAKDASGNLYSWGINNTWIPYGSSKAKGDHSNQPSGGKYQAEGVYHVGEWVVPDNGSLVIRGEDRESLSVLKDIHSVLKLIAANPTSFSVLLNGNGEAGGHNYYQRSKARL